MVSRTGPEGGLPTLSQPEKIMVSGDDFEAVVWTPFESRIRGGQRAIEQRDRVVNDFTPGVWTNGGSNKVR